MNSRPTIQQYRRLAEGLIRKALEAPPEKKQDLIHHAASYLAFARAQEASEEVMVGGSPSDPVNPDEAEKGYHQVRHLIKQAIELPTPDGIANFLNYSTAFRRLGIWNARMAYIQRPGARVIASEYEWNTISRLVLPDAIPIMILWPFSPIRYVYELEDTEPRIERDKVKDPFAVKGHFHPKALPTLISSIKQQKRFKISFEPRRQGFGGAGTASSHGARPEVSNSILWEQGSRIGEFASENGTSSQQKIIEGIPSYRVTFNDRLAPAERFVTIAHELGHIFLGHLGECESGKSDDDESGWPDRRWLGKSEKEVEAEAVAFLVASRAGVVTASAQYLKEYAARADMTRIDLGLIVRSAARIERMAKIRYGSMAFKPPS
jgi:IrrE N-terminal-like domain